MTVARDGLQVSGLFPSFPRVCTESGYEPVLLSVRVMWVHTRRVAAR